MTVSEGEYNMEANGGKARLVRDLTGEDVGYPEYGVLMPKGTTGEIIELEIVSGELEGVTVRFNRPEGPVEWSFSESLVIPEMEAVLIDIYRDAWLYVHDCAAFGDPSLDYASWDNAESRMDEIMSALPHVNWVKINLQILEEFSGDEDMSLDFDDE
jgi:hypothetical protein